MKNLKDLGFVFDSEMEMFYAKTPEQVKELIGEKIYFTYTDFDNGSIKGIGFIKGITEYDIDEDGEGSFSVDFKCESGDTFFGFIFAKDCEFSDGNVFRGGIFAGDNMDRVLFKIVE